MLSERSQASTACEVNRAATRAGSMIIEIFIVILQVDPAVTALEAPNTQQLILLHAAGMEMADRRAGFVTPHSKARIVQAQEAVPDGWPRYRVAPSHRAIQPRNSAAI